jgi:hypothetical protein
MSISMDESIQKIVSDAIKESRDVVDRARKEAEKLLLAKSISELMETPETGGVYIIRKSNEGILYIGKARNLQRRICTDHLSREKRDSMSAFRRSVHDKYGIPFGVEMREWILKNCTFAYLEIADADMRSLVEALLVATCRTELLLNKF